MRRFLADAALLALLSTLAGGLAAASLPAGGSTAAAAQADPATPVQAPAALKRRLALGVASLAKSCIEAPHGSAVATPGTPHERIEGVLEAMRRTVERNPWTGEGEGYEMPDAGARFRPAFRWNGFGDRGQPVDITYSFPPDGISVVDPGDSSGVNVLNATLTSNFGSEQVWKDFFRDRFDDWEAVTGVTYTEVPDDGATWPSAPGPLTGGSGRGDIRIVMGAILTFENGMFVPDGPSGVIAFNFFPNGGDMLFDEADDFRWTPGSTQFANTITHENGHGMGLRHTCPQDGTKVMEPIINANFLGPQFDDRLSMHWLYGDRFEPNSSGATSVDLPALGLTTNGVPLILRELSLHSPSEFDLLRFNAELGTDISVQVRAVGPTYSESEQTEDCDTGEPFAASEIGDLLLEVLRPNFSVFASADDFGLGGDETLAGLVADEAGTWYVRVRAANSFDEAQMYDLTISTEGGGVAADLSGDGCVDATDLAILLAAWGTSSGDVTGDGVTNAADLASVVAAWTGTGC